LGAQAGFLSLVVPVIDGVPLSFHDLALGYSVLKVVQAVVMSLAAVPVYVWCRSLASRGYALLAAALTLALPQLAYSGLVMSEVAFYPLFVLAGWAMARALAAPSGRNQALFVAAFLLVAATRLQAVVLAPALVTALLLEALLRRSRPRLRPLL